MTKRYTAADFANARFAEHEDGRGAHRVEYGTVFSWSLDRLNGESDYAPDEYMAHHGWVPVPTKPQITQSELRDKIEVHGESWANGYHTALNDLGIEVIPDPEPTNADKLEAILKVAWTPAQSARTFAEWLDSNGVTAPNVKDN